MNLTHEEYRLLETICREPGCYRKSGPGVTVCNQCLHGISPRASDEAIALKKRVDKEARRRIRDIVR